MPSKFSFKKNVQYDIALLTEVEALNPYASKCAKPVWTEVAKNLVQSSLKMKVGDRSCRERVELLLKGFRKDEGLSNRASGITEDEMDQLKKLLTSVSELEDGKAVKACGPSIYSKSSRKDGEKIRDAAVQNMSNLDALDDDLVDDENEVVLEGDPNLPLQHKKGIVGNNPGSPVIDPPTAKKRPRQENELVKYLENKNKEEINFKRDELEIRRLEAENRKKELEANLEIKQKELALQKERQDAEIEEKKRFSELLIQLMHKNK